MPAVLVHDNYGKSKVRLVKVSRNGSLHEMKELSVDIQLEGDFLDVHKTGNNSKVLPTDTMKNTVYALAKNDSLNSIEEFALNLASHFIRNNEQVSQASISITQTLWYRMSVKGDGNEIKPHDHSFISAGNEKRTARVIKSRNKEEVFGGIDGLLIMKTTNSGFEHYIKDEYTTLKETSDRIFETVVKADWKYNSGYGDFNSSYNNIRQELLEAFAVHKSLSVQQTLYYMGERALDKCPEIETILLSLPNKHCLLFDLSRFGMDNNNEIFVPTDEPHGLIEAVLSRGS